MRHEQETMIRTKPRFTVWKRARGHIVRCKFCHLGFPCGDAITTAAKLRRHSKTHKKA